MERMLLEKLIVRLLIRNLSIFYGTRRFVLRVGSTGEKKSVYIFVVGKRDGKRPLGRPKNRCEVTIKMNLEERSWEGLVCFILAQDRD